MNSTPSSKPLTSKTRIEALKNILNEGLASTQEEICDELRKLSYDITQSTVSRDLRRLGAVRAVNSQGEVTYRLPHVSFESVPEAMASGLSGMIKDIKHNGYVIVIHTSVGSASLIAKHIDDVKLNGILGTIAGDDTIFIIPSSPAETESTIQAIYEEFE